MFQLYQKLGNVHTTATQQRNICVVLGCIAEKLAGPSSIAILSDVTLDYLVSNLVSLYSHHCIKKSIFYKFSYVFSFHIISERR